VDELDGADIDPARGMGRDHDLGVVFDFPADDELLLVPAGQRRRLGVGVRRLNVVLPDDFVGVSTDGPPVHDSALGVRFDGLVPQ